MQRTQESINCCYSSPTSFDDLPSLHLFPYIKVIFSRISSFSRGYSALFILLFLQHMISVAGAGVVVREVRVPDPAIVGQPARLECLWESQDYYSVRWYLNDEQFYSYIVGNHPEKVNHDMAGVNVAIKHSNAQVVTLSEVTLDSEGIYRCEVMSEAPFFQTSVREARLRVVDLPEKPEIRGLRELYHVGDMLNATCTARDAKPRAKISFELNGVQYSPDSGHVKELQPSRGSHRDVFTSSSQLLVPIESHQGSILEVKCVASIDNIRVEESLTVTVEPARTRMLFFNAAAPSASPSSIALLTVAVAFLTLRIATFFY
ncbi:uncharacterized protein [Palaemon carinicauda]|uniref:uncharacterized protein n=1 Tax=Palaemon carinicauda TaxID=392227 RepID=UPI0035B60D04